MSDKALLDGKVAIVTGAGRGVGREIALLMAQKGACVVVNDLGGTGGGEGEDALPATEVVNEITAAGGKAVANFDSVTDSAAAQGMVDQAIENFGKLDIVVNNAGIVVGAEFLDLEEDDFDKVLSINLKGAFLCSQAVARHMVEKVDNGGDPGCIINMSSINSVVAIPNQIPYCVSKGGMTQLTKTTALSLAKYGIRVNAIGPGSIMTEMLASVNSDPAAKNRIMSRTPMLRIGEPSEIAGVAAFLASEDAGYVTGQTIFADGGRMPLNYTVAVPEDD